MIEDPKILEILKAMPCLTNLNMKGNPCISKIKHYRKVLISAIPKLNYLDGRPVFPNEREIAEAFVSEGMSRDAEKRVRKAQQDRAKAVSDEV